MMAQEVTAFPPNGFFTGSVFQEPSGLILCPPSVVFKFPLRFPDGYSFDSFFNTLTEQRLYFFDKTPFKLGVVFLSHLSPRVSLFVFFFRPLTGTFCTTVRGGVPTVTQTVLILFFKGTVWPL